MCPAPCFPLKHLQQWEATFILASWQPNLRHFGSVSSLRPAGEPEAAIILRGGSWAQRASADVGSHWGQGPQAPQPHGRPGGSAGPPGLACGRPVRKSGPVWRLCSFVPLGNPSPTLPVVQRLKIVVSCLSGFLVVYGGRVILVLVSPS